MSTKITPSEREMARRYLRTYLWKRNYNIARNKLPALLRSTHPEIYKELMQILETDLNKNLSKVVELRLQQSPEGLRTMLEAIKRRKASDKAKRDLERKKGGSQ